MPYRRYYNSNSSSGCGSFVIAYVVLMIVSSLCSSGKATASSSVPSIANSYNSSGIQAQSPTSRSSQCDPAYPDACLVDGIGDYDCAGGSGNGPNYAPRRIRVLPPDPFGLDRDGDGVGC